MTINTIHEQMLSEISSEYSKIIGTPAYDFTRAFAYGCYQVSKLVEVAESKLDIENLKNYELDKWVWQRKGLSRKSGAPAYATMTIVSASGTVKMDAGFVFSTDDGKEYTSIDTGDLEVGDTFTVQAVDVGDEYNVDSGAIHIIKSTIPNLGSVTNGTAASGGTDAETDERLRVRYQTVCANASNGVNAGSYVDWALECVGVGQAVCVPCEDASGNTTAGHCSVYIVDADGVPCTTAVQNAVKAYIDPHQNGDGEGTAPMGAVCHIKVPQTVTINVSLTVDGVYEEDDVKNAVKDFVHSHAFGFGKISYGGMVDAVIHVDGVTDVDLQINDAKSSITIPSNKTAVVGTVTVA